MFGRGSVLKFLMAAVVLATASPAFANPAKTDLRHLAGHGLGVLAKSPAEKLSSQPEEFEPTAGTVQQAFLKVFPQYQTAASPSCELKTADLAKNTSGFLYLHSATVEPSFLAIQITADTRPNAFAVEESAAAAEMQTIVLSGGLLRLVRNQGELSFVLAHEMSHIRHRHRYDEPFLEAMLSPKQREHVAAIHRQWELDADQEALDAVTSAGFSSPSSVTLLSRLSQYERPLTSELPADHPSINARIEALNENQHLSFLTPSEGKNF